MIMSFTLVNYTNLRVTQVLSSKLLYNLMLYQGYHWCNLIGKSKNRDAVANRLWLLVLLYTYVLYFVLLSANVF